MKAFEESEFSDKYLEWRKTRIISRYGLKRRIEALSDCLRMYGNGSSGISVLDIGSADGRMLASLQRELPEGFWVAMDKEYHFMDHGLIDTGVHFVQGDATDLPFRKSSFDMIIISSLLKHLPRPMHMISECRRLLKPGGVFLILDPSPLGIKLGLRLGHFRQESIRNVFSLDELSRLLEKCELDVIHRDYFMILPFPLWGARFLESLFRGIGLTQFFLSQIVIARKIEAFSASTIRIDEKEQRSG